MSISQTGKASIHPSIINPGFSATLRHESLTIDEGNPSNARRHAKAFTNAIRSQRNLRARIQNPHAERCIRGTMHPIEIIKNRINASSSIPFIHCFSLCLRRKPTPWLGFSLMYLG